MSTKRTATAPLTIKKVKRTNKRIFVGFHNGTEDRTVNSTDNALPDFSKSLDALSPLVCDICGFTKTYAQDLRVVGVVIGSQGDADTVSILAQKSLRDAGKALQITTPPRLLKHPTEPGTYTPPIAEVDAELVYALIEASKDYAKGNRAQGELPLLNPVEGDGDDFSDEAPGKTQPDDTAPIPGIGEDGPPAGEVKPKGKRKGK